ncbi:Cell division protein FtsL [Micrococcus flavus]
MVPAPLPRSGSGVAVLCAVVLLVALALVLVMNISMSNRQYGLIDLRDRLVEVTEANERLAEQVGYLDAPQNLAARADALGMVPAAGAGIVDADAGEVAPATARRESADLVTGHVGPPADADEARQGLAAAADAEAELAGPRTLTPAEAAAAASEAAAAPTDGSDEH